ncbi:S-adenosyl-L-methionine-dependent methyltransferase [Astrocystis sublimbata]|nr:S-adenosyl-L-methionine-dependent methyltransferase [Astrocystis sublimbata]
MTANPPLITSTEWAVIAPGMAQMIAGGPGVAPAKHMAEHSNAMLPFSNAGTVVVDMGCGPGQVTNAVLEAYHDQLPTAAKVIGADSNPHMLGEYENRKTTEIGKGNTHWERSESLKIDIHTCDGLADNSVTHMLCGFVVFLIPNPGEAIAAMKRVMAPGGVIAMSSLASSQWSELSTYPARVRGETNAPSGPANGCSAPEDVKNHLQKAGFQDIEVLQVESYMEFDDYETVCNFILTKLPMATRIVGTMTEEEVSKTRAMMVAKLKSWCPELPAKLTGEVNIAYARK